MATMLNPLKPLVLVFNPSTFPSYLFARNEYYYYTVEIQRPYDGYRIFTGKAWAKNYLYTGYGEITIDLSSLIKPYMYKGKELLEPEYDANALTLTTTWTQPGAFVYGLNYRDYATYGFGVTKVYVHFYQSDITNIRVQNAVAVKEIEVTSSWDINGDINHANDTFDTQEISQYEFGQTFISHYPRVLTDNFGVFGLINISHQYYDDTIDTSNGVILQVGNDLTTALQLKGVGDTAYTGGYLPFKFKLSQIVNTLQEWTQDEILERNIVGGNASRAPQNYINTGTAQSYVVENVFYGGDAQGHGAGREGFDRSNSIYYMPKPTDFPLNPGPQPQRSQYNTEEEYEEALAQWTDRVHHQGSETWIRFAELDTCPKKYYLVWMTRSCTPACFGFDGNTVYSESYEDTLLTNIYNMEMSKIQNITKKYELKSGVINKATYSAMEDIFTSPWCLLYDVSTDTSVYVRPTDTTFTRKNSMKEDKQPFMFNINLQELSKIEIFR